MTDLEILRKIEGRIGEKFKKISEDEIKEGFNSFLLLDNYYSINKNNEITGILIHNINYKKFYDLIINLKKLKYLDLSYNQIIDISALKDLTNLNTLYLDGNQISDISALKDLTNLNTLDLRNNQISDISTLEDLTNLNTLDLSDNQISDISALKDLTNLNTLDLSNNQISDISALKDLTNLNTLYLSNNQISDISALKDLTNLNTLYLHNNQISDISALKDLTNLNNLYLHNNQIIDISALKDLTNLTYLKLSDNQISDISALKDLTNLNNLSLFNNQISDISALKDLKKLKILYLNTNKIKILSEWITDFKEMDIFWKENFYYDGLNLYNNPIESPPIEIIEQGKEAIRNYFSQIKKHGTIPIYEAKLMFVGEPGSGKTSLMEKLLNPKYKIPCEINSTLGVDVRAGWAFPYTKDNTIEFKANLWDFGGQEIQFMLHQFFLTARSFYVLLADDRKQDTNFDYWFNIIRLLGGQSPVLVVLNEKNYQSITNFDYEEYVKRYSELSIERFDIDLANENEKFKNLFLKIQTNLSNLKHIGDPLPAKWSEIRKELESLKNKNHISISEYFTLCNKHSITKEEDALYLSGYLNDIGVILHYKDDPVLSDIIFINPQWVVSAIYIILSDKKLENNGKFTKNWLFNVWKDKNYTYEERNKLLSLMLKNNFELCYDINDNEYIAPILLTKIRPKFNWDETDNLQFRFKYPFMPKGIISRLIVRLNEYIIKENDNFLVWESGAVLQKGNVKALVYHELTRDEGVNVIIIKLFGEIYLKTEFLTIICENIEQIHKKSFKELYYEKLFPCTCKECKHSINPYFFKYTDLIKRIEKGKQTIECRDSTEDVEINKILMIIKDESDKLLKSILQASKTLQSEYKTLNLGQKEDNRTNFISIELKKYNIITKPQKPHGDSETGKSFGEVDIVLEDKNQQTSALVEAFNLKCLSSDVISSHLTKLFNYDKNGLDENYVLIYVETDKFFDLWQKYFDFVKNIDFKYKLFDIQDISRDIGTPADIRVACARQDRNKKIIRTYHIFIYLNAFKWSISNKS